MPDIPCPLGEGLVCEIQKTREKYIDIGRTRHGSFVSCAENGKCLVWEKLSADARTEVNFPFR